MPAGSHTWPAFLYLGCWFVRNGGFGATHPFKKKRTLDPERQRQKMFSFRVRERGEDGREKICRCVHILLASRTIRRILFFANSLQPNDLRERGSQTEDATKN